MTHYSVLGVARKSSREEIVAAYRRRALQCHPDKPGGSVELFNRLKAAYDVLQDAAKRSTYDGELAELRRKKNFRAPPPLSNPRMPEAFHLPDGSKYVFETAPDRLKCKFRHGDVVRHTDGEQGVFVGIAGDGLYYWCPINTTHAVPLNTFGGEKDIAILFRQNTSTSTRTGPPGRVPSRSAPRPAGGSFSGSFASASSANAERADRAAASRMDAEIKRRTADAEKLEKQRLRRFQGAVSQIVTEESARRYTLVRASERHWENFHADCKRAAERISRRYQSSAVTPARRRTSTAPGQRNESDAASPAASPQSPPIASSPKESTHPRTVPARETRSQRPPARTTTPTPVRAGSKAAGQRAAPAPAATGPSYRSVRPRIFAHVATPPPAAVPRRSVSPEAEHDASPEQRSSAERHGGHTPRSQHARAVPTVDPNAPLSPPAKVKPPQATVAPLNLDHVRAGDDADNDDGRSPTEGPLDAPRGKSQPQEYVDPTAQQPRPARVPAKATPRPGVPTRTASKSAAATTLRRATPATNPRTATPRSTMTPRAAAPAAAPALHSVRINNAFLHRRGTTAPSSAMDEEHREEYDNLVRAAMRRQHTPRRGNTPSSRRTSSAVPTRTAPNTPAEPQASSSQSPFERHSKSPDGKPTGAPTGHQPPELLQSVRPRLRRMSEDNN